MNTALSFEYFGILPEEIKSEIVAHASNNFDVLGLKTLASLRLCSSTTKGVVDEPCTLGLKRETVNETGWEILKKKFEIWNIHIIRESQVKTKRTISTSQFLLDLAIKYNMPPHKQLLWLLLDAEKTLNDLTFDLSKVNMVNIPTDIKVNIVSIPVDKNISLEKLIENESYIIMAENEDCAYKRLWYHIGKTRADLWMIEWTNFVNALVVQ